MEGTIITKKGMQLLVKLLATKSNLKFTHVSVGTGILPAGYDPASMVGLVAYRMDGIISECKACDDIARITMQISSTGIESGFTMTEMGVFAEDPDIGEILYAYLNMKDDPQYIYAEGGEAQKFIEITLDVAIESATKVTTYINPNSLITRGEFEKGLSKIENPEFDDSGTVKNITSFTDFLTSFATGTNIYKFLSNLKAGLQFVLHAGQLVNDCVTDREDLPLSAAQGKALMDQITVLNTNLPYYKLSDNHLDIRSALPYVTPTRGILLVAGHSVAENIYKGITALDVYVDGVNFKTPPCTIANTANLTSTTAAIFPLAAGSRITKVGSEYSIVDKVYFYPKS